MTTLRKQYRNKGFTVLDNVPIQDNALSWEALGMYVYLMSKPDGWKVMIGPLARERKAGKDKVARILNELESTGYLRRWRQRSENGTFLYFTDLFEEPAQNTTYMAGQPEPGKPEPVKPGVVLSKDLASKDLELQNLSLENGREYLPEEVQLPENRERDSNNKPNSDSKAKQSPELQEVIRLYEQIIGTTVTPLLIKSFERDLKKYPAGWLQKALEHSKGRGVGSWSYVGRVLEGWEVNGLPQEQQPREKNQNRGPEDMKHTDGPSTLTIIGEE